MGFNHGPFFTLATLLADLAHMFGWSDWLYPTGWWAQLLPLRLNRDALGCCLHQMIAVSVMMAAIFILDDEHSSIDGTITIENIFIIGLNWLPSLYYIRIYRWALILESQSFKNLESHSLCDYLLVLQSVVRTILFNDYSALFSYGDDRTTVLLHEFEIIPIYFYFIFPSSLFPSYLFAGLKVLINNLESTFASALDYYFRFLSHNHFLNIY